MRNITTIVCLGLALGLTACVPNASENRQWMPWQLATERQENLIELSFACKQFDLSEAQKKSIMLAKKGLQGKTACHALVTINHHNAETEKHIRSLTTYLVKLGIKSQHIKVTDLAPFDEKTSELSVRLEEYEVVIPRCPGWTQAMTDEYGQNVGPGGELNFGCTTQYNLSRMIAHPKDIVEPQKLGAGNGQYLSKIIDDLNKNKAASDPSKKSAGTSTTSSSDSSSN